jgi:hypothetical protein
MEVDGLQASTAAIGVCGKPVVPLTFCLARTVPRRPLATPVAGTLRARKGRDVTLYATEAGRSFHGPVGACNTENRATGARRLAQCAGGCTPRRAGDGRLGGRLMGGMRRGLADEDGGLRDGERERREVVSSATTSKREHRGQAFRFSARYGTEREGRATARQCDDGCGYGDGGAPGYQHGRRR